MSTELALKESSEVLITSEQVGIIKTTVCKDATDAEMQLYFYDCQRRGVHPLDRLIHFTKRGGRYAPVTSIDFFYQRAHATEQFAGQDETVFKGQPGQAGFEATVRVYRQRPGLDKAGWSATARWSEYFPGDQQGHMWRKMPTRMLEKCAEALALRKAFPAELQGLYVKEEMDQAGVDGAAARSSAPQPTKAASVLNRMKGSGAGESSLPSAPSAPVPSPQEHVAGVSAGDMGSGGAADPITYGEACQKMMAAESVREISTIMNEVLDADFKPDQLKTITDLKNEAMKKLAPAKR